MCVLCVKRWIKRQKFKIFLLPEILEVLEAVCTDHKCRRNLQQRIDSSASSKYRQLSNLSNFCWNRCSKFCTNLSNSFSSIQRLRRRVCSRKIFSFPAEVDASLGSSTWPAQPEWRPDIRCTAEVRLPSREEVPPEDQNTI